MNNICIAGTVGNSEVRYLNNGDPVLQFSVADNQGKDKPTLWWSCTLWGKRAESLGNFVQKGGKVTVTGTVVEEHYTDKSGQEKKAMKVKVNDIALQGGKAEADEKPARQDKPKQDLTDDDIPF
jgi:single-strand DNA-binding protein